MTITYPRALPLCGANRCDFDIERQEVVGGEQGGRIISNELGPPHWRMKFSRKPTARREYDQWVGWTSSLRGSGKLFYGRDMRRGKWPREYRTNGFTDVTRAGGGAFDGTATSIDLTDRFVPEFSGLPAGFKLSINDYVGFSWGTRNARSLHRIVEDGVADGSGVIAISVEPEIQAFVPGDAVATFAAPTCLMLIVPGTLDLSDDDRDLRVAFEAIQYHETRQD